jgi:hypothetical protein
MPGNVEDGKALAGVEGRQEAPGHGKAPRDAAGRGLLQEKGRVHRTAEEAFEAEQGVQREERGAAQGEEVVQGADRPQAQDLGEDRRDARLVPGVRRDEGNVQLPLRGRRVGETGTVDLPRPQSGQVARQGNEPSRHRFGRQGCGEALPQGWEIRVAVRGDPGDQGPFPEIDGGVTDSGQLA